MLTLVYSIGVSVLLAAVLAGFVWAHVHYDESVEKEKFQVFDAEKGIKWFPCFYCGVDTREFAVILASVIGSLILGSVAILIWAWLSGMFRNVEKPKYEVFEAEKRC